jgi:hypothetical protein
MLMVWAALPPGQAERNGHARLAVKDRSGCAARLLLLSG